MMSMQAGMPRPFNANARSVAVALAALLCAANASGQDASIPLYDGPGGANCNYFNVAGRVKWQHRNGDWKDASGAAQGNAPFARAHVESNDLARVIEWEATALVRQWISSASVDTALLLRTAPGGGRGTVYFHSREADDVAARPRLLLEFADGTRHSLVADADVHLDCSTVRVFGSDKLLQAGPDTPVLMRFVLPPQARASEVRRATLRLTTTAKQYGGADFGIFLLDAPRMIPHGKPELGLASEFLRDDGIAKHPDVLMATGFESTGWLSDWSQVTPELTFGTTDNDESLKFKPLAGKALRVRIPRGANLGLDLSYNFKGKAGVEPEEIYFRYYLRLADDFLSDVDGGKLPGVSGTYGRAGWGGRKWDGKAGWSMRGGFARSPEVGNPMRSYVTISTYAYHAAAEDFWGDEWVWDIGLRGVLSRNRWYCIEQYFRVNHVGASDGEMKGWVDGELAFHRTGIRVRDVPDIRIEKIWMNVYHGGTSAAARDLHLYIDNVVIARRYIGPMRRQ